VPNLGTIETVVLGGKFRVSELVASRDSMRQAWAHDTAHIKPPTPGDPALSHS